MQLDESLLHQPVSLTLQCVRVWLRIMQLLQNVCVQLDQVGHDFYVFLDQESRQVRVVYRRKEEGYGVIIPHTLGS